jgi:hypothetical protein
LGPFKRQLWDLSPEALGEITRAWETQFRLLFERLGVAGTQAEVSQHVRTVSVSPGLPAFLQAAGVSEDVGDLAD